MTEAILSKLNEEQSKAVYSSSKYVLCIAGAGTGKTTTALAKLWYLTEELRYNPASILCLTFTRVAADEMASRHKAMSSSPITPYFATFHSFCYDVMCRSEVVRKVLGYSRIPEIISERDERAYISKVNVLTSINLPKRQYKRSYTPTFKEKFDYTCFHKELSRLYRTDNVISFDYLLSQISELFISNHPSIRNIKDKYKYILIDEFQDTDPLQWKTMKSFTYSSFFVCGDIRQAIYGFRGGDSSIMKSLLNDNKWDINPLSINYRSDRAIISYANSLCDEEFKLHSTSPNLGSVEYVNFDNISFDRDTAILCKTNKEVDIVKQILDNKHIAYTQKHNDDISRLFIASLGEDELHDYVISCLPNAKLEYYFRSKFEHYTNFDNTWIESQPEYLEAKEKVEKFKLLPEYENLVASYEKGELDLDALTKSYRDENIYVGTVHSVKGKEFDVVVMYKEYYKDSDNEQDTNLWYVGVTRAKHTLLICEG